MSIIILIINLFQIYTASKSEEFLDTLLDTFIHHDVKYCI